MASSIASTSTTGPPSRATWSRTPRRFRNAGKGGDVAPLGICHHFGMALHFALPRNAQAKIAERTYAVLSRAIDDRPEFRGAHAGHAPGASPTANVVPVPIALAAEIIRREFERHNREPGRRLRGAHGRSCEAVFDGALKGRITRVPSSRQLQLAGLIHTPASVDRCGRVKIDGWTYGGPETQDKLLRYHGKGLVLIGRNPDDLNAAALAFDADRRLICEGIELVRRGAYGSIDGIHDAARYRKAARAAVDAKTRAHNTMDDAEMHVAWADLTKASAAKVSPDAPEHDRRVVAARFGAPVQSGPNVAPVRHAEPFEIPAIYQNRLGRHLAEAMKRSAGEGA